VRPRAAPVPRVGVRSLYSGGTVNVPVHLHKSNGEYPDLPVLLTPGGVDTWKMDVHQMCVSAAQATGATVMAFDMPGTGELANVPLNKGADKIILGLALVAKRLGNGRTGHIALSFGANFSTLTGLTGAVDAAVSDGGPSRTPSPSTT
jgi:esterase FrsA